MSLTAPQPRVASTSDTRYLSGQISDFLALGGSTLFLLPILFLLPVDSLEGSFGVGTFFLAMAINNPHFAVSYRLFYEDFGDKISPATQPDQVLRYRYIVAGIVVPALLCVALVAVAITGSRQLLGYGFNLMTLSVGWHYVKQGYGMAMVDSALKRRFLSAVEKKVLLINGYAVWAFSWMLMNRSDDLDEYRGVPVSWFNLPDLLLVLTGAIMAASTVAVAVVFARRALANTPTAWIGVVAYLVSLYPWLVLVHRNVLFALVVPALHSLQYLWVVRRFQLNRHDADASKRSWRSQYARSVVLGLGIFLVIPLGLLAFVTLDADVWGTVPFMFISVIFINVHHYFLDNVMWRRGNPEVSQHLFAG